DGIRVWRDDQMVIDDWTLHPPKRQSYEFEVVEAQREIALRVEYFELDGSATLQVSVAPAPE
ncbi:MAG TPA: PA14 domain-containing protein, partial [Phycisphaerales bacterium]|nr:PA14 domain-containing protein [Phycisphaerales bacterium]